MDPAQTITACLVAYHEEEVIERCLRSLEGVVDELIVIHDGPCGDRTLEIAERFGARTAELPRVGHAERHTVTAYEWAAGPWIFTIDADEFLSDELRAHLRELVQDPDANGFEFLWRMWDGERHITQDGPFRLALFRKRAVHVTGHIHAVEQVDPPVVRTPYALEHQPLYNNYTMRTVLTKWRRWARIDAEEALMPLEELPSFNMPEPPRWTLRRAVLNRLSPVLFVPYFAGAFVAEFLKHNDEYTFVQSVRHALQMATYNTMVQLYVAKRLYVDPLVARVR